jgi:hypothetical protein
LFDKIVAVAARAILAAAQQVIQGKNQPSHSGKDPVDESGIASAPGQPQDAFEEGEDACDQAVKVKD